jgi:hypothetical protein
MGVGQLIVGPLSDARGRRGPLLATFPLHIVSSLVVALAPSVELVTIARFGQGFGAAAGAVVTSAMIRDLYSGPVEARVTNRGGVTGTTVLQLYARVRVTGIVRPAQRLVGFARVELAPGSRPGFGSGSTHFCWEPPAWTAPSASIPARSCSCSHSTPSTPSSSTQHESPALESCPTHATARCFP